MDTLQKKGQLILIVDDAPNNIKVIGTILRRKDFQVSIAQSGRQALEQFSRMRQEQDGHAGAAKGVD